LQVFDTADIAALRSSGTLDKVIMHEMGHVLGIGTLWDYASLVGSAPTCPYKVASNATREWQTISGCINTAPVETDGGAGTACGHWDETCMRDELMTGYLSGTAQKISRITVGALADLGFAVNYNAADNYLKSDLDATCRCGSMLKAVTAMPPEQRPLSDEGRANAVAFGQSILARNQAPAHFSLSNSDMDTNIRDFGTNFLTVFYEEASQVYSVRVTPHD
jgi:hypothetical protein